MSEETTTTEVEAKTDAPEEKEDDQRVPYERFEKVNKQAREFKDRARALESELADIRQQLEDREHAGLPELEQMKKRLEQAEKRAEDNERKAQEADARVLRSQKERWVTSAAKEFADASDAAAFVNFEDIESEADAERAVKRVAKAKPHLLKQDDKKLPGRVMENGRTVTTDDKPKGGLDPFSDAQVIADGLRQFASRD